MFNALLYAGGDGPLNHKPLTAKTISVVAATLVTYTGNRVWTFRHRARTGFAREYVLFFLLNGVGLGIALLSGDLTLRARTVRTTGGQRGRQRDRPRPGHPVPVLVLSAVGVPGSGVPSRVRADRLICGRPSAALRRPCGYAVRP